jgi:hypothetical protein
VLDPHLPSTKKVCISRNRMAEGDINVAQHILTMQLLTFLSETTGWRFCWSNSATRGSFKALSKYVRRQFFQFRTSETKGQNSNAFDRRRNQLLIQHTSIDQSVSIKYLSLFGLYCTVAGRCPLPATVLLCVKCCWIFSFI